MIDRPQTLPQWLDYNASARGDAIAYRRKQQGVWKELRWSDAFAEVRALACGLASRSVRRGETVLLIGENSPQMYFAELAAMAVGAKTVCLYPDASEQDIAYVVEDAQAVCAFAEDQEQVDKVLAVAKPVPALTSVVYWEPEGLWNYRDTVLLEFARLQEAGRAWADQHPGAFEQMLAAGRAEDVALLNYTSGTTGKPKGVIASHGWLLHSAQLFRDALALAPESEYLSYIPLAWSTEQSIGVTLGLTLPLLVNFAERPDQVQEAIRELAVEVLFLGPRQWESLASKVHARMLDGGRLRRGLVERALALGRAVNVTRTATSLQHALYRIAEFFVLRPLREQLGLKRTRHAFTGGAAISPDVFHLFASMGVRLRNLYGCSEYGLISAHVGERYDPETIGEPAAQPSEWGSALEWRISGAGELQLRGGAGFLGYWGRPDKTAERMDDGWYRTGDAVGVDTAGRLIYYDRLDHLSQLASGERYPKQYLEVRLRFSPYIKEVMVIGDTRRPYVVALVNIDYDVCSRWAEQRRIAFTTFADLSQRPEMIAQIAKEVARVNASLPGNSRIVRFANLPKELDADEGELTRTRKLRREFIEERYGRLIEALYSGADEVDLAIPVRYQDGRTATFQARARLAGTARGEHREAV